MTISGAIRDHWIFFLLPLVLLVSAAVAAGLLRSPAYTAEARLAVGGLDASSTATNSDFATTAAALAQTYGRSIQGDAVVGAVARDTETSPEYVRAHISAFTVPGTPLFTVQATARSSETAIVLANLSSAALSRAADQATEDTVSPLLRRYREAEVDAQQAARQVRYLQSVESRDELVAARSNLEIAEARADSAREAFIAGRQRQQTLAVPIQVIEKASTATSDRYSTLQLWIFAAVVLGLILGTAAALLRESWLSRYATT